MGKKILVIDDEELIIRSLVKLLEMNGYEAYIAKTGQDAMIMVEEENFDLILSDIRMPGMNGIESVQNIFKILDENKVKRPPIIFITGYASKESEQKAKNLKPVDYIYKPFDISKLVDQIRRVLN